MRETRAATFLGCRVRQPHVAFDLYTNTLSILHNMPQLADLRNKYLLRYPRLLRPVLTFRLHDSNIMRPVQRNARLLH